MESFKQGLTLIDVEAAKVGDVTLFVGVYVMDPIFWTRNRPSLRWWAALRIEECQCPELGRVTHPA
jgi:hypothetical protein